MFAVLANQDGGDDDSVLSDSDSEKSSFLLSRKSK